MNKKIAFNEIKFQELILLLADRFRDEVFFGATKLHKLLFFCDFLAYERLGYPITGAEYIAQEFGPFARYLGLAELKMVMDGDVITEQRKYQHRIIPCREPNLGVFNSEELGIINYVVSALRQATSEEVSDLAHQLPGWQKARSEGLVQGEYMVIPYGAGPVSAVLMAAKLSKDSKYHESVAAGFRDVEQGRYSSLEDVRRRLSGV